MRHWMNFIMLSCKKATYLIEKRQESQLSVKEKILITMHLSFCDACKSYDKQSKIINKAIFKWFTPNKLKKESLPPKVKEKIIEKIKNS